MTEKRSRRTKLQQVSSDHVWARMQVRAFLTVMKIWRRNKHIKIHPQLQKDVIILLERVEKAVEESYVNYKKGHRKP